MDLIEIEKMIAEAVSRYKYALENCRLYAARHRKEEWAQHILRFCADAEVVGSPTRETSAASGLDRNVMRKGK